MGSAVAFAVGAEVIGLGVTRQSGRFAGTAVCRSAPLRRPEGGFQGVYRAVGSAVGFAVGRGDWIGGDEAERALLSLPMSKNGM